MEVHGLGALEGETAFAFVVLRLAAPTDRAGLLDVLRYVAPLIPDADQFMAELPDELDEAMRIIGIPWAPPEAGHAVEAQRRLIEGAGARGVEAAWFFQTGTSLPTEGAEEEDEDDDDEPRATTTDDESSSDDDGWEAGTDPRTEPVEPVELVDEASAADPEVTWSNGPPPQRAEVRFPVDGYPSIVDELDWEDFGIAIKFRGEAIAGEGTVLLGFHNLWLAPYGGRYRNAAVTFDRKHHAAHLWVDRFAVPCSPEEQVRHLLWIVARIDEVVPVVHARFAEATMAQKYGGLMGDTSEPFVLGGNPLLALYATAGEAAVDAWIATQTDWSKAELAQMLRELAIDIVTTGRGEIDVEDEAAEPDEVEDEDEDDDGDGDDDEDDDDDDDDDDEDDDEDDDDEAEGNEDEERGRQITIYAGDLLRARAEAGALDARAADSLLPVLEHAEKFEHRRRAVVEILGALRYRPAVPAMIRILEGTVIESSLDSIGKEDFLVATAAALGAIGDPSAIPALSKVVAAVGTHNDTPRPVAADALASCLAAAPEPRAVDDAVLAELLTTIRERNDGELNAASHFAYGRIARQLPPDRRAEARRRLAEVDSARDDSTAMLARQAALVLASSTTPALAPPHTLAPLLHEGLTGLDYDHDYTVRNVRIALRVAEVLPALVDVADLTWLTRFAEPDIRAKAHALLARLGPAIPAARVIDRAAASGLADDELVRLIGEPHLVGRAALIAEVGRRTLAAARPAIVAACDDVITRARQGSANLMHPDTRVLETAVPALRTAPLDAEVVALFDRMLRHSNFHVKWELLQAPPKDERLIGSMFHVLGERWGWQEKAAKQWLAQFQGSPAYEAERKRAGSPAVEPDDELPEDEDMN